MDRRTVLAGLSAALPGIAAAAASPRTEFTSADGVILSGSSFGSGAHAVLLVPGGHGVGETWLYQAERLANAGFRVLAMDYRGRGFANATKPDDEKADLDVIGAVRHLRTEGAITVAVVGASWGGWAAGTASIKEPALIDRLVLLAHSAVERPELMRSPKLFIVALGDEDGRGRRRLESIREQFDRTPDPKKLVVLEGSAHAQFLFLTNQAERLYREIADFLAEDRRSGARKG